MTTLQNTIVCRLERLYQVPVKETLFMNVDHIAHVVKPALAEWFRKDYGNIYCYFRKLLYVAVK